MMNASIIHATRMQDVKIHQDHFHVPVTQATQGMVLTAEVRSLSETFHA